MYGRPVACALDTCVCGFVCCVCCVSTFVWRVWCDMLCCFVWHVNCGVGPCSVRCLYACARGEQAGVRACHQVPCSGSACL